MRPILHDSLLLEVPMCARVANIVVVVESGIIEWFHLHKPFLTHSLSKRSIMVYILVQLCTNLCLLTVWLPLCTMIVWKSNISYLWIAMIVVTLTRNKNWCIYYFFVVFSIVQSLSCVVDYDLIIDWTYLWLFIMLEKNCWPWFLSL